METAYAYSLFCISLLILIPIDGSVRVQNRYSLGEKLTYAENKATTTVNLLTGKETIKQEETIYTEHIVELDDPLINASAEIEKTYSFVRFTPADERAVRRLFSQRTRENFKNIVDPSSEFSIGDRRTHKPFPNTEGFMVVTRIYESDEYDTKVITFNIEVIGAISVLAYDMPFHSWITKEVDVETGVLLFEQEIRKSTIIDDQKTETTVEKLIKHERHIHEL